MNKRLLLLSIAIIFITKAFAQRDTIRIVNYNLLNYGGSSNPTAYKNPRLDTIISYLKPDIFSANEIADNPSYSNTILSSVLKAGWAKGTYANSSNQVQTNMLFWKTDKFQLINQTTISFSVRDIIAFKLYYKDTITKPHDSVFVTVIVVHFKAGNTPADETDRTAETQTIVNYLNALNKETNNIVMGDMNVYTSNEQAYKNLINAPNPNTQFFDPINRPGDWHANSSFADLHTQATRTASLPDGGITGGMDDRFDILLQSKSIRDGLHGMQYLIGSYKALGQDGQHHNKAINAAPTNTSAPANVIQALYEMSDHLPIYADFIVDPNLQPSDVPVIKSSLAGMYQVVNPTYTDDVIIKFSQALMGKQLTLKLYNVTGKLMVTKQITVSNSYDFISTNSVLQQGMYILTVEDGTNISTSKIIKM